MSVLISHPDHKLSDGT